jgi:hypothetical protein
VSSWLKTYERFWASHIDRVKQQAERKIMDRLAQEKRIKKDKEN